MFDFGYTLIFTPLETMSLAWPAFAFTSNLEQTRPTLLRDASVKRRKITSWCVYRLIVALITA